MHSYAEQTKVEMFKNSQKQNHECVVSAVADFGIQRLREYA